MAVRMTIFGSCLFTVVAMLAMTLLAGCKKDDGLSELQRQEKKKTDAIDALKQNGAKFTEESYPQFSKEKAWAIDLSGQQISDETFNLLKKTGHITNLNLSKTNVTDAHMDRLNEMGIGNLLVKLNLSNTAITDAGLAKLPDLLVIRDLNLSATKVTPAGVEQFKSTRASNPKIQDRFKSPPAIKL